MLIKTQVTLSDGRTVNAYYLDDEGQRFIHNIESLIRFQTEPLDKKLRVLMAILEPQLKEYLKAAF